jgi:hypothetical protein
MPNLGSFLDSPSSNIWQSSTALGESLGGGAISLGAGLSSGATSLGSGFTPSVGAGASATSLSGSGGMGSFLFNDASGGSASAIDPTSLNY